MLLTVLNQLHLIESLPSFKMDVSNANAFCLAGLKCAPVMSLMSLAMHCLAYCAAHLVNYEAQVCGFRNTFSQCW